MIREKRLNEIMRLLKEKGHINIKTICDKLKISEVTARRDLRFLESQGLIERKRGGATLKNFSIDVPFFFKLESMKKEKKKIAQKVVSLLENGQVVAMSGGTTIFYAVQELNNSPIHDLTIITNSITTAWAVINLGKSFKLIHSGGTVREDSFECAGGYTVNFFQNLKVDIFLLGVNGIDLRNGVTFYNFEEAVIAKKILENSSKLVVLADSSKIGLSFPYKICDLSGIDILVTDELTNELSQSLKNAGVREIL